ncbi:PWWP domain-containing protein 2A-like [Megalops cyprinoides]|uniref:PWWP domain-containing protein 2A-like n=1 Tax=Megalops cyprinoides TaxID=118141 RepID=UPI001864D65F|nr:PWWP domain-containing protein 2A-like [Megalops cyprinoides]XP_036404505.1 PWWP domain-containing protein 2A-like [Megalops cyprinoides]
MAAVAAEPGASAALTTAAGDGVELEPEIAQPVTAEAKLEAEATKEFSPVMDLVHLPKNGDAAQGCSLMHAETQCRPDPESVGKPFFNFEEGKHTVAANPRGSELPTDHGSQAGGLRDLGCEAENLKAELPPTMEATDEVSSYDACSYHEAALSPEPAAGTSPNSDHAPGILIETGLAAPLPCLVEPVEPAAECAALSDQDLAEPTELECDGRALTEPSPETELKLESGVAGDDAAPRAESGNEPAEDAVLQCPETAEHRESLPVTENEKSHGTTEEQSRNDRNSEFLELPLVVADPQVPAVSEPEDLRARQRMHESGESEPELKPAVAGEEGAGLLSGPVAHLIPGSEVRVSLDHIIDDALVVSFRLGEKIFSGVLMDLSKRFGPYGIPVTVFPKREYRDKPESMQLKTEPLPLEVDKGAERDTSDAPPTEPAQPPLAPNPALNQWTSKPPPLFQEGAPYPPPLFIRDTYSQSIPQPPPRKIKRPKRKLYREEPTSIMNAIKLRPRQVLCDKCKGTVAADKREPRRGPASDCRAEDAKRRRGDSVATVAKRPRADLRAEGRAADGARRPAPVVRVSAVGQGRAVVRAVATATAGPASPANTGSKVQLNTKKVLQNKNVDHPTAGEVLKMAKAAQRRQRDRVGAQANSKMGGRTRVTRASSPQGTHQKVHYTRRLHQISGGGRAGGGNTNPLPPRIRIKPQRYRNEENDSSTCKPPGFDKVPGGGSRSPPKLNPPTRCTSTRSSSSLSGEATAAAESQGPARELDPELSPQTQPQPQPQSHPGMEPSAQPLPAKEQRDLGAEPEEVQEKGGDKASNITVYMSLNPSQQDSSNISVCSGDSADDLKSSNSECSSTETFDFPPPGVLHSPPAPSTSSTLTTSSTSSSSSSSSSSAPKEDKKPSKSMKAAVFSKNVSKCVTTDGRTICVGDIVWAKIYGFPWWPARILVITVSRKDNGLLVRQEARISWFGSPTTSFLALSQVTPFLENFQLRFDKKRKGLYRKAITEAAKAAKQLTPEVRALLTQFET